MGEHIASVCLLLKGYRIIERNYRCRLGETDIIAVHRGVLIFVEVRTRGAGSIVDPISSVDPVKISRIINAARCYLMALPVPHPPCRFDLVTITTRGPRHHKEHIPGAFDLTSGEYEVGKRILASRRRRRFPRKRKGQER
jgi:putative endonuclease